MTEIIKEQTIFDKILTDGKWNKFSIGDNENEWVDSLSYEEYYATVNIRWARGSLIGFATEGIVQRKPNWEQIPDGEPKCDLVPFLGYRSGKLKVTSVYFPENWFKEVGENSAPSSVTSRLRCIVKCDCGNEADYSVQAIKSKKVTECGCEREQILPTTLDIVDGKLVTSANKNFNKSGYVTYSINKGEYNGKVFHGPYSEHKLIYEMYHGVTLTSNQNIHHKNGVRDDNHIDNLELWDTSQPAGQRVLDKLSYYFELVKSHSVNPLYKEEIESQLSQLELGKHR